MAEPSNIDLFIQEAQSSMSREDWGTAIAKLEAILDIDPTNVGAVGLLRQAKQQQTLATLYAQGRKHYQAGRWTEALECFRQVQDLGGNYRQADLIVATIENRLSLKQRQNQIAALNREAQTAMDSEDWGTAIAKLQAILELEPTHEEAAVMLIQAQQGLELENLYAQGRRHYEAGRKRVALEYFRRIQAMAGSYYENVGTLIAAIEREMAREEKVGAQEPGGLDFNQRLLMIGSAVWVLLLLVFGGAYLASAGLIRVPPPAPTLTRASTNTLAPPLLSPTPANTPVVPSEPPSAAPTPTPLPSATFTPIQSPGFTPIPTLTFTSAPMPAFSPTPTPSFTPTPSATFTRIPTETLTPTPTLTFVPTPATVYIPTSTATFTPTPTETPMPTPTETPTPTPTLVFISTSTSTFTTTPTTPLMPSPTSTETPTPTSTLVSIPTSTATFTPRPTPSVVPPPPFTFTPTAGLTPTSTFTFTPTPDLIVTPTGTPTSRSSSALPPAPIVTSNESVSSTPAPPISGPVLIPMMPEYPITPVIPGVFLQ